jgi:hypothetical protein
MRCDEWCMMASSLTRVLISYACLACDMHVLAMPVWTTCAPWPGRVFTDTPLDLQGFDYTNQNYDQWHSEAPNIPSISSESSSAVSDRGEYYDNATTGHVSGYDVFHPDSGTPAEWAWGGINVSANQGILTRPYICGGCGLSSSSTHCPISHPTPSLQRGPMCDAGPDMRAPSPPSPLYH